MKPVMAIDPGSTQSAYVIWDGKAILEKAIWSNEDLLELLLMGVEGQPELVIEQVRSYGMSVGANVFDTVFWSGRFYQAWNGKAYQVPRMDVKMHLCHSSRANDASIRRALIDRFEPDLKPRQRPKGVLEGLVRDEWAAAALSVFWFDQKNSKGEA
jgi:hypothetical protein